MLNVEGCREAAGHGRQGALAHAARVRYPVAAGLHRRAGPLPRGGDGSGDPCRHCPAPCARPYVRQHDFGDETRAREAAATTRRGELMTLKLAIMIEGQEGLTWERWERLARLAEDEGYDGLFRSDHLTGLFGDPTRPSLDAWASLTWLGAATRRIRFGPLVCPITFYHPALLARRAAAVSQLSGGRLELGVGAGWHEGEHRLFGIPFPPLKERMDRLECGLRVIRALDEGKPVTIDQPYYSLVEAQSYPLPVGGRLPVT